MTLPQKLEELLKKDSSLHGSVLISYAEFDPVLRLGKTPFFPEYTDHSAKHILEVLQAASSLVRDEAWPVLTPSDAGLLCLATLLHDCAMHLTEDGFLSLVSDPLRPTSIPGEPAWPVMWADFLSEASRFDGRKLTELFGSNEPINRPDPDPINWKQRDRLLIGEFVRRHHPRLAHEIATVGLPGPVGNRLELKQVPTDLARLAGLIARSHGLPLRECLKHLDPADPREFKGVHAVFLMALLRVGDYIQIQAERAPRQILKVQTLRSPVSQREWRIHSAVVDIRNTHDDPEALFVQTAPEEVQTYLKLKHRLQDLQSELDSSWAVIGEVYGRFGALAKLGLTIRRIRSNLDDERAFAATVPYIPCDAKFDAAGADLLKLLIHPLYGDKPEVGIRELMQNSVDACIELADFLKQRTPSSPPDFSDQDADVVVTIEQNSEGQRYIIVSDRGIGMTPSVVLNYFLKAGASFRQSELWRQQHESEPGRSRVLRSGRFGVGALAAFLLGDEMMVSTRHVNAPPNEGIAFSATLDSEEIQLNRVERPVGTTIRVRISDGAVWNELTGGSWRWEEYPEPDNTSLPRWDFYCISGMSVKRVFVHQGLGRSLSQRWRFPGPEAELLPPWHRIAVPGYADIQWAYIPRAPRLVCNGIAVTRRSRYEHSTPIGEGMSFNRPTVSVFDRDGLLPLNLQRTDVATRDLPFQQQLVESQCEDFIAWALVNAPTASPTSPLDARRDHSAVSYEKPRHTFAFVSDGSVLADSWFIREVSPSKAVFFPLTANISLSLGPDEVLVPLDLEGAGNAARKAWFRCAVADWNFRMSFKLYEVLKPYGRRTIIRTGFYEELRKPRVIAQFLWGKITVESSNKVWTVLRSGKNLAGQIDFNVLVNTPVDSGVDGLTEYLHDSEDESPKTPQGSTDQPEASTLAAAWRRVAGDVIIPYDLDQRRKRFRAAYERLRPTIEHYEAIRQTSSKQ